MGTVFCPYFLPTQSVLGFLGSNCDPGSLFRQGYHDGSSVLKGSFGKPPFRGSL